jgi:hypothetical protein
MVEKYNGWANYETWAVNLWLSNEESSYLEIRAICKDGDEEYSGSQKLKEFVMEEIDRVLEGFSNSTYSGIISDVARANLSLVDWAEIWKAFREE